MSDSEIEPLSEDADAIRYSYKAAVIGAPWELTLRSNGLHWQVGALAGLVPYARIRRVRLSYRPATMQPHRFLMELWSDGGPKIKALSTSWRNVTDQARQDAEYRAFVLALHERLAKAGGAAVLRAGAPLPLYVAGVVVFVAAVVAFIGVAIRALQSTQWAAAAVVAGLFAIFAWQLGTYFVRNRPQHYRADAIPPQVLPKG